MTKLGIPMTPRLAAVLDAGDAKNLHAVMTGWSEHELRELHWELHLTYNLARQDLDDSYRQQVQRNGFPPEIEALYMEQRLGLATVFTEIHEVLRFYLDQKPEGAIQ